MATSYPRLKEARALNNHSIILLFSNGEKRLYDFSPNLCHPYYKILQNVSLFMNLSILDGEIVWATGQDFCPHTLYINSVSYIE